MLKEYFFKSSLDRKLVAMMLVLSLSLISILIFLYYHSEKALFNEFERQSSGLLKAVQIGLEEVGGSGISDEKRLRSYLEKLNPHGVREISVINTSDRIISSTDPKSIGKWITKSKKELILKAELGEPVTGEGQMYDVMIPIVSGGQNMGYIHLSVSAEDFSVFLKASALRRIVAATLILMVGMVLSVFLARRYTRPIKEVVEAAREVASGALDVELRDERKDEIGELSRSFNFMVGKLREERDLRGRLREAEHLASIGQFSRSIAHEIKNPLNFMSLSIDHIKEEYRPRDPSRQASFDSLIRNIKSEIQRVSKFTESFLEYGKPLKLNLQPSDMGRLVEDVLEMVAAQAQKEGIEIRKSLEALPHLSVDADLMKTCLYNVIMNSFQAMGDGGVLTVSAALREAGAVISVEDTGAGIPEDLRQKVFDPFFTTKPRGLGLGLSLTKRVIEEHGGRVNIRGGADRGTVVSFVLPLSGPRGGAAKGI
ncbi:MAG: HAMP domain-containing sensor histidine kinase [Thermodesulfovibrionales bacterium]